MGKVLCPVCRGRQTNSKGKNCYFCGGTGTVNEFMPSDWKDKKK